MLLHIYEMSAFDQQHKTSGEAVKRFVCDVLEIHRAKL